MGGFFGPTREFDDFLATYMTPAMTDAGFKRSGRQFTLRGPGGAAVIVHPRLYTPMPIVTFFVQWAAVPTVLRDYIVERHPKWRPSIRWGLVRTRLTVPEELRDGLYDRSSWHFAPDGQVLPDHLRKDRWLTESVFGEAFSEVLTDSAIPKWQRAFTTEYLRNAHDTDEDLKHGGGEGEMRGGPHWTAAILGVDHDDPGDAARAIDVMAERNERDPIIPWLRARLAARASR